MARDHARIRLTIWEDDDYRALSPGAQHLYFVLSIHPALDYCGVTDWRPSKLSGFAANWNPQHIERAGQELSEQRYIVIDDATEEVLLRSFIRNDGLLDSPNMAVAVRKAHLSIASATLRGVVVHELQRLNADQPDLRGWEKLEAILEKTAVDPASLTPFTPSRNPSVKGSGNPSANPSGNPSATPSGRGSGNPSGNPSGIPSPTPYSLAPSSSLPTPISNSLNAGATCKASPDPATAHTIVSEWLERVKRPPSSVIGQTSKFVKQMLDEGIDPDDVRRGVAEWMSKGLHPSTLPSVVNEVMNKQPNGKSRQQRETDDLFARAADRMGVAK